jgi:hypothetical protein
MLSHSFKFNHFSKEAPDGRMRRLPTAPSKNSASGRPAKAQAQPFQCNGRKKKNNLNFGPTTKWKCPKHQMIQ